MAQWSSPNPDPTHLYVPQQSGQVKLPLLTEAGELQQEADGVVGLVQTGQTLDGSDGVQALRTGGGGGWGG